MFGGGKLNGGALKLSGRQSPPDDSRFVRGPVNVVVNKQASASGRKVMKALNNVFGLASARLVRFPISISPILVATLFGTIDWRARSVPKECMSWTKLLDSPIVHGFLPQSNERMTESAWR